METRSLVAHFQLPLCCDIEAQKKNKALEDVVLALMRNGLAQKV